ncbi:MAG: hypothetical protein ACJ8G1_05840 [Vitreoscilla sp.]
MFAYDPSIPPEPEAWLELDELERIRLVEAFHRKLRGRPPNLKAHAVFHAIVENQLAEGVESVVRAMSRLNGEGLSRHDALHAIGSALAAHLNDLAAARPDEPPGVAHARYEALVDRLSAAEWRRLGGKK